MNVCYSETYEQIACVNGEQWLSTKTNVTYRLTKCSSSHSHGPWNSCVELYKVHDSWWRGVIRSKCYEKSCFSTFQGQIAMTKLQCEDDTWTIVVVRRHTKLLLKIVVLYFQLRIRVHHYTTTLFFRSITFYSITSLTKARYQLAVISN